MRQRRREVCVRAARPERREALDAFDGLWVKRRSLERDGAEVALPDDDARLAHLLGDVRDDLLRPLARRARRLLPTAEQPPLHARLRAGVAHADDVDRVQRGAGRGDRPRFEEAAANCPVDADANRRKQHDWRQCWRGGRRGHDGARVGEAIVIEQPSTDHVDGESWAHRRGGGGEKSRRECVERHIDTHT